MVLNGNWQLETGYYKVSEITTAVANPKLPTGTKYLECTSNGTISISADLDSFTDKGYIYIDRYNGSSWTRYESTVSDLSTNESWFNYSNKKITLTGTTGDRFANLKIYNGVKQ